jgi:hypothetical protein
MEGGVNRGITREQMMWFIGKITQKNPEEPYFFIPLDPFNSQTTVRQEAIIHGGIV